MSNDNTVELTFEKLVDTRTHITDAAGKPVWQYEPNLPHTAGVPHTVGTVMVDALFALPAQDPDSALMTGDEKFDLDFIAQKIMKAKDGIAKITNQDEVVIRQRVGKFYGVAFVGFVWRALNAAETIQ